MSDSLRVLADNRPALLLAEIAGWLHDMGKCDDQHLQQEASDYTGSRSYDYKTAHSGLVGMNHTLTLLGESVSLKQLIEEGRPRFVSDMSKPWLIRVLGHCHGAAHVEKEENYYLLKQTVGDTRLGNLFGYESKPLIGLTTQLTSLPFNSLSIHTVFKSEVEKAFSRACGDTRRPDNEVTLWDWSGSVAALYKATLAAALLGYKDDPPNLRWRLLSIRLNGGGFSERVARIPDLQVRQKIILDSLNRVRTLLEETYPLGTEVYRDEDGSVFIVPNIANLLDLENEQKGRLSTLIINEFSAGTINLQPSLQLSGEVIPSLKLDSTPWQAKATRGRVARGELPPITEHLKEVPPPQADLNVVGSWWQGYSEDICSVCGLRPQGWGASDNKVHYGFRTKGEKCPLKPTCQTCKTLERKVCSICEQRREDRSKEWAAKLETTIWINEIADVNGRLALVVGKFDLEHWLNGKMLFYLRGKLNNLGENVDGQMSPPQIIAKVRAMGALLTDGQVITLREGARDYHYGWSESEGVLIGPEGAPVPRRFKNNHLNVHHPINQDIEVTDVRKQPDGQYRIALNNPLSGLSPGDSCRILGQEFRVVEDGSWVETVNDEAVKKVEDVILHPNLLIVEHTCKKYSMVEAQSLTRLRRIWETTKQFWKEVGDAFGHDNVIGTVSPRLRILGQFVPETGSPDTLGASHAYDIKLDISRLSIVCVKEGEFLTAENLLHLARLLNAPEQYQKDYCTAAMYVRDLLRNGGPFDVEEPTGYGSPNKLRGKLRITDVTPEMTPYVPAIPILAEPRTFMALVPASKALDVAKAIKTKYEVEMGKVRNRLPLTLGLAFASSRTPLSAILAAGRRMLKQPIENEFWEIKKIEPPHAPDSWPDEVTLTLEREGQSLQVRVRTVMGDGKTRDDWYPYWRVKNDEDNAKLKGRTRQFTGPDGAEWVHICDLQVGDAVYLTPSRFDFEFLDAAARRFEISYNNGKRRGIVQQARPYYLEQLDEFDRFWRILSAGLVTSQIKNLEGILEVKRTEWTEQSGDTFKQTAHDILSNANWKPSKRPASDDFEELYRAAVNGQLADVIELFMEILKLKPEADTAEVNQ